MQTLPLKDMHNLFRDGFFLLNVLVSHAFRHGYSGEPECVSKFDYDYKMLQKVVELEEKFKALEEKLKLQESLIDKMSTDVTGSVYIRWGRTVCPDDALLIYTGYTAGKKYTDKGSGSNSLCMPSDPSWFNYTEGVDKWRGRIYGAEFEITREFPYPFHDQDMPCTVCLSSKSAVLMIPGRTSCYQSLRHEYSGYLMSGYHSHSGAQNYICVDSSPDVLAKGGTDDSQHLMYLVESMCGSLPCPPYIQGRELACVVCSI